LGLDPASAGCNLCVTAGEETMSVWAKGLIALVALMHLGFLAMEMLLWTTPTVMGIFRTTPDFAKQSQALAANMGLYNGFLAAGLIWSLIAPAPLGRTLAFFFLGCVVVAGVFGAFTVKITILFVQALPAVLALAAVIFS
jgi:putative membrane protein